jgi:predicted metalloprotease with PDZ domain
MKGCAKFVLAGAKVLAACLFVTAVAVFAEPAPISYSIALASPEQHLVRVQIFLPPGSSDRDLQLPVWNALYQVRDFSQYVNWVHAKDRTGKTLAVRNVDKSRWRVAGAADGAIVEYEIYLDLPGPFGAQFNTHHAFFNLAEVLMYPIDARVAPCLLRFSQVPQGWKIATPLKSATDAYSAENYDRLVDSPVEVGTFDESDFDESGGHFRVIFDAEPPDYDAQKIVANLHKIIAAEISWMNDRPFDTYVFVFHFPHGPGDGGMEHAYSTAIDLGAESMRQGLYPFNAVAAHEFFHLWNVKRIRPQTLEPPDYTKENYTRALWFSEGVTSTVEDITLLRAGLMDEKQFLAHLGDAITELQRRPAHLTQSAEESSLDAWLEGFNYYRRPERSISYYNKGELLGVLLDLTLRDASRGNASLRELFQWMNANVARKGRFFDDSNGVSEAAQAVSHASLDSFFTKYVALTEEIPWNDFFRSIGLRVDAISNTVADPGFTLTRSFDGPLSVGAVQSGSEAERAGLQAGDIILEIQGKPPAGFYREPWASMNPGDTLSAKVRNRRGEHELKWKLGSRQQIGYVVNDLESVSVAQRARRAAWLKGEAQPRESASQ